MANIEVEFRAIFDENKYNKLKEFLDKNAEDLGEDDKDVHFFILPDKLLKVVNNISKKSAKIVIKLQKIGKGSDFEEIEVNISPADVDSAVRILKSIREYETIMNTFQKRHNYLYRNVELALKWSEVWGYHLELEILINSIEKKKEAEKKIRELAKELDVHIMTDEELIEFTKQAEEKHKRKSNKAS